MPGQVRIGIKGGAATFSRTLGPHSAFGEQVQAAAATVAEARLHDVGKDAVRRAEAYVSSHYETRGAGRKNRYISQVPLAGSMRYVIRRHNRGFPVTIELYSEADPIKVNSLNSGAVAHEISGRNGGNLLFPSSRAYAITNPNRRQGTQRVARPARFETARRRLLGGTTGGMTKTPTVQHPGIKPSYFMENALEGAVNAVLRKTIRIPRH